MTDRTEIADIVRASINAPSGSNSQPWRFVQSAPHSVDVYALPQKDHPVLNFRKRGTLFAHGALMENIHVVAASRGLEASIRIMPDDTDPDHTAHIHVRPCAPGEESLAAAVAKRATNRQRFAKRPLTMEQMTYLADSARDTDSAVTLAAVTNGNEIRRIADAVAVNEAVTLEDRRLHELFFREIVWSREEEARKKMGLYVRTMGLQPPQEFLLGRLTGWRMMSILNRIGFARFIARQNAVTYAAAPYIGIVTVADDDPSFIAAGRAVERMWLKATLLGFGFHLMSGISFYHQCMTGGAYDFSPTHRKLITRAYADIAQIAALPAGSVIAAIFRLGPCRPPKAYSTKSEPNFS